MSQKTVQIAYRSEEVSPDGETAHPHDAQITVSRASAEMGMERSLLRFRGTAGDHQSWSEAKAALLAYTYPDLIAATTAHAGEIALLDERICDLSVWPISPNDFLLIPDDLVIEWETATYAVNPHWNPAGVVEKKA
jgi:hypothetical protein